MQRRVALKNLVLAAGGLVALPAWAQGWSKDSLGLVPAEDSLLAEIAETILPATNTPGAKDLEIPVFVRKMLADCYEPEVQESVEQGMKTVEQLAQQIYGKPFRVCNNTQREEVLTRMEISIDQSWSGFYKLMKELTLQDYLTSAYYLTNHTNFKMVPGHFYGCVPVAASPNPAGK